jgi:dTDP-4-dehydrorhamnose reductase
MSKLIGEWFAAETPRHYVLRVESLFGGPRAKSSVDMLLKGMREGKPVRAFADRTVSPSFVDDVVDATRALVEQHAPFGVYHCVNSGHATWVDVAEEVARLAHIPKAVIEAVPVAAVKLKASRPTYAALSNAKILAAGAKLPTWREALKRYLDAGRAT